MTFTLPEGLAPEVYPLAWLVGEWEGSGELAYPGIEPSAFRQRVSFDHDGGPYLTYRSSIELMGPDGEQGQVWQVESGFWRVAPSAPEGVELQDFQHPLEVIMTEASGVISAYMGAVGNGRVDLATRFVASTESGPEVRGATRMYGNVKGELMWAWDLAAFGQELQSYAAARMTRVDAPVVPDLAEADGESSEPS